MAGDWIKFEIGTSDKPEVWAIAQDLSIDPDAVVGKLLRVWSWFDQHTENGNAAIVTKLLLDRNVGVTGFCNSLISCGWMEEADGFIYLPNFDRHNGKTAKNRAVTAKRVASFKENKRQGNDEGNGEVTPAPLPREEKRREEKNKKISDAVASSCSEPIDSKPEISEPPIIEILTNKTGETGKINRQQYDRWVETYPAVDVWQTLLRIRSWAESNPAKRKTAKGIPRFVDRWLAQEQDKPRVNPGGATAPVVFLNSRERNAVRSAHTFDYQQGTDFGDPHCE